MLLGRNVKLANYCDFSHRSTGIKIIVVRGGLVLTRKLDDEIVEIGDR